ncbi:hypothetical protein [Jonesia denitrificans]|uniref:N-acetyltransferase domain-containing protein n=1 Tax=Jonesia denitrificans (strain ATCC 14870 / DSM 20603 / BCRC 15368 / CIP 55.134 / JCM 11481 / NBRC 15587 / NCTC 10816 / Prevot 55134) TaxID=471856 RepID=C7R344_JONDD|nr:hypothetical protein [Jonesia denitrificans]ACV10092.1 conserved hypothetical protein [Jonesia denitrificans DSM 20603]ASE08680.1 hypothetical protein CEP80_05710 [Jonesia denitrificans]QXB43286.1 hypothetical protein I6L70_12520 [Jonesia denitrificans]SQH22948.1 Uncharacterised protein [Jonesia denitrificans]
MNWLEVLGWVGSGIVVVSLLQTRILRLRVLNLTGCTISVVYALLGAVWPILGLNAVLAIINIYHLRKLLAAKENERAYTVVSVDPSDAYLSFLLSKHAHDIAATHPDFGTTSTQPTEAHLVLHDDETVGVVLLHAEGDGTARIILDYVTPRFRDFSPGRYLFQDSGLLASRGYTRVIAPATVDAPTRKYYEAVGFTSADNELALAVTA